MLSGKISSSFFCNFLFFSTTSSCCFCRLQKNIQIMLHCTFITQNVKLTSQLFSGVEFSRRSHVSRGWAHAAARHSCFEYPYFRVALKWNELCKFSAEHNTKIASFFEFGKLTFFVFRHKLNLMFFQSLILVAELCDDDVVVDLQFGRWIERDRPRWWTRWQFWIVMDLRR